jgi:phosphoribosylaminoimidazole (AIR) synthetase
VDDAEMFRTFNMGVGLIIVCDPRHAPDLVAALPDSWIIGRVV